MELKTFFIALLVVDLFCVNGGQILEQFANYTIVFPRQHSDNKSNRHINTIIDEELGAHQHYVSFGLEIGKSREYVVLDLEINKNLMSSRFTQSVYTDEGLVSVDTGDKDLHHCNYHGNVRGIEDSDVRLSTCNGLRGFIDYDDNFYFIEPISDNHTTDGHVVYKPTDRLHFRSQDGAPSCGVESATNQDAPTIDNLMELQQQRRRKRSVSPKQKYFVETLIVMDKENYDRFKTREERLSHVKEVINLVDGYYKPLNFRVVLSHIEFWEKENRVVMNTNASQVLDVFMDYRRERLITKDAASQAWHRTDVSHLLYGREFDGTTIGKAHVKAMCGYKSGSINQDIDTPLSVAPTVTHEMGHNLGMLHDNPNTCTCKQGTHCVMAAVASSNPSQTWSQCSEADLQNGLDLGLGKCLTNVPDAGTLYLGPVCGNDIVERGEECDCGSPIDCTSKCCDASSCMLHAEAECAYGECCSDCKFRPSGTMCRSADGNECELPEFCNGNTPFCPENVYREDGSKCNNTEFCHDGICLTHDLQCKMTWGNDATNGDDLCYIYVNKQGTPQGNCGKKYREYRKCQPKNVKCGKLNCHSPSRYPKSEELATEYLNYRNSVKGVKKTCRTIGSGKDGLQDVDEPAMVQEGTGCGENKVCRDYKCTQITLKCTNKCNSRGVCNNKGNCHCDPGWSPPYCLKKGRGGSIDSGSVAKGDKGTTLMIILLVVATFLIFLAISLTWYCVCGGKMKIKAWKQNRREKLVAMGELQGEAVGESTSGTSSTFSLVLTQDQNVDLMKDSQSGLRTIASSGISYPAPVRLSAPARSPPKPTRHQQVHPVVLPTVPPTSKKPIQRRAPPPPPSAMKKLISANQLRSGDSMTPPPPPPSSKKPLGGGKKTYSKPNTPAKLSSVSKPQNGRPKPSGNDKDGDGCAISVQALKARFNEV